MKNLLYTHMCIFLRKGSITSDSQRSMALEVSMPSLKPSSTILLEVRQGRQCFQFRNHIHCGTTFHCQGAFSWYTHLGIEGKRACLKNSHMRAWTTSPGMSSKIWVFKCKIKLKLGWVLLIKIFFKKKKAFDHKTNKYLLRI